MRIRTELRTDGWTGGQCNPLSVLPLVILIGNGKESKNNLFLNDNFFEL